MNLVNQGESSGGPLVQPAKRRRGRPRRDENLRYGETPPGFEGVRKNTTHGAGIEHVVGQAVTGVVEAMFDGGYLLNVRIGESNTNLRGVVFKPGHCAPITPQNDVAPHVPMISRSCPSTKRKYVRRNPVGFKGTMVQSFNFPSGMQTSSLGDCNVHMAEPLSMLPPDQPIHTARDFTTALPHPNDQVFPVNNDDDDDSFPEGTSEEKLKPTMPDADTSGSSQTSDSMETLKPSVEVSGIALKQETGNTNESFQASSVMQPLFNYGTGRMTELLQAVQENLKEPHVQVADRHPSATGIEFQ